MKFVQATLWMDSDSIGSIDSIFGPKTKQAVVQYQKRKGLVADGIIGPKTWRAMRADYRLSGNYLSKSTILDKLTLNRSTDEWTLRSIERGSAGFVISSGRVR